MSLFVWKWSDEDEAVEVSLNDALERLYEFATDELNDGDERHTFLIECRDLIARELSERAHRR